MTTPHKHADVIKAWADGAEIEFLDPGSMTWIVCESDPRWDAVVEYRVKPTPITREEIIIGLRECQENDDTEVAHSIADDLLCDLLVSLGYNDVVEEYHAVRKWYA